MSSSSKALLAVAAGFLGVCLILTGVVVATAMSPQVLILAGGAIVMLVGACVAFIASTRRDGDVNRSRGVSTSPFAPNRWEAATPDANTSYPRPSSSVTASMALPGTIFMPDQAAAPKPSPAVASAPAAARASAPAAARASAPPPGVAPSPAPSPMFDPSRRVHSLDAAHHTPTPRALPSDATHHTPPPRPWTSLTHMDAVAAPAPVPVAAPMPSPVAAPELAPAASVASYPSAAPAPSQVHVPVGRPSVEEHFSLTNSGELSQEILNGLLDARSQRAEPEVSRADLSKGLGALAAVDPTRKLDPGSQHRLRHASSMDDPSPSHGMSLDDEGMPSVFSGSFSLSGEVNLGQVSFDVQDEVERLRRVIQADEDAHAENLDAFRSQVPGLTD